MKIRKNTEGARTRLTREQRHEKLLEAALDVVRSEGVDALTLATAAERAGVTKPIAYDHFGTRAKLLVALYRTIDREQTAAARSAFTAVPKDLAMAAKLVAGAYMHCYANTSGEWHAIAAALRGNAEMAAAHQEILENYIALFASALGPFSSYRDRQLTLACSGLVGAAESLSAIMVRGEISEADAVKMLTHMIVRTLARE